MNPEIYKSKYSSISTLFRDTGVTIQEIKELKVVPMRETGKGRVMEQGRCYSFS